jgi:hypothetical protein
MKQAKAKTLDKLTHAMDHLNREKLPYEQQDVPDRHARFILYAAMERVGDAPAAHFRKYIGGLEGEPPASPEGMIEALNHEIDGFLARQPVIVPRDAAHEVAQMVYLRDYLNEHTTAAH